MCRENLKSADNNFKLLISQNDCVYKKLAFTIMLIKSL